MVAVGLRPCSGAIIVLVFALAQDVFWTGVGATLLMGLGTAVTVAAIATVAVSARQVASRIASTRAGYGMLAIRAIEVGAAAVIVVFGALVAGRLYGDGAALDVHKMTRYETASPRKESSFVARQTRLVFIGRDLPKDLLSQGFEACCARGS